MKTKIENIKISGLSLCLPKNVEENFGHPIFGKEQGGMFIKTTGVERRHIADENTCASDLCYAATEKLIAELNWNKEEIECLVFVSQTGDYKMPATACILQEKLGLSKSCLCFDINMGCSGYVYGLNVISSLMKCGNTKKGLLLCGETASRFCSDKDKTTYPLFGDSGTSTALEYSENTTPIYFDLNTDGKGANSIWIPDGGYRNPFNSESLKYYVKGEGIELNNTQMILEGMDVFSFSITQPPKAINSIIEDAGKSIDEVDYFILHQANKFMNEKIIKKVKIPSEKAPLCLQDIGNTSGSSIPTTMVYRIRDQLKTKHNKLVLCGFGVGLSWGSIYLETDNLVIPEIIEI